MPVTTQTAPPCSFAAGDTVLFSQSWPNYLASLWDLDFILSRNGQLLSTTRATKDGDTFLVTLATAALVPGAAKWSEVLTEISSKQRKTVCSGGVTILPDPTANLVPSENQKALTDAKAAMAKLMSGFHSVSFNGQSFTRQDIGNLQQRIDRLELLVQAELRELGLSNKGGAQTIQHFFRR